MMSILSAAKKLVTGKDGYEKTKKKIRKPVKKTETQASKQDAGEGRYVDLQPWLTEKAVKLQSEQVAVFRVMKSARKQHVAAAIEENFKVKVLKIRLVSMCPKRRRRGNTEGWTTAWKKAYVKVDDISKIVSKP
jgi:large subunit ribosomal protein L23